MGKILIQLASNSFHSENDFIWETIQKNHTKIFLMFYHFLRLQGVCLQESYLGLVFSLYKSKMPEFLRKE